MEASEDICSDGAVVNLLKRCSLCRAVTPAQSRNHRQLLLARFLHRLQHGAHAGAVHSNRLLAKDMLAGFDTSLQMSRAKSGRGGKQHHVHAALNHLLIRVESHEAMFRIDLNSIFGLLLQDSQAAFQAVFERIGHRRQDDVLISRQRLRSGASSPATATHQSHLECIAVGCIGLLRKAEVRGSNASRRCRLGQKLTP